VTAKDLAKRIEGQALVICEEEEGCFITDRAREVKERRLKLVWSNEMMCPFRGEEDAVKQGLMDRIPFVSDFQKAAFAELYPGVPSFLTGNYIDPDDYAWCDRRNSSAPPLCGNATALV
jgi:hypothetical protein